MDGEILFDGEDILKIDMDDMRRVRGAKMSMVFQEPMTSLNPVLTLEKQLSETLQLHKGMTREEARGELPSPAAGRRRGLRFTRERAVSNPPELVG